MRVERLVLLPITALAFYLPGAAATIPMAPPPAAAQSKPVPPLTSALKSFAENAVQGKFAGRDRPENPAAPESKVCSIPLVEALPPEARPKSRMPKMPARSLDHNQVPPPAPPCTADNRIRPKPPAPGFKGPGPHLIPLEAPDATAVRHGK